MPGYNENISPSEQVDAEEAIAAIIFDAQERLAEDHAFDEEDCNELGRKILLEVLTRFRPDLIES